MRHDLRALRDQVIHVRRPILDRRITDPRVRRNVNFDNAAMERALGILRRGTALNVVNLSAFVRDNQRPLELADIRRIQPEIRLKREIDLDALGDVNERTARPDGAVQRCEFIITIRDDRPEKLPEKIGVLSKAVFDTEEDNALLFEKGQNTMIDHLGFVLRPNAGEELLLRFGDPEPVERNRNFAKAFAEIRLR